MPAASPSCLSPAEDLVYEVFSRAMGFQYALGAVPREMPAALLGCALFDVEDRFDVELDVDDAWRAPDLLALIRIAAERAEARKASRPWSVTSAEIIDLAAARHARSGRPGVRP